MKRGEGGGGDDGGDGGGMVACEHGDGAGARPHHR